MLDLTGRNWIGLLAENTAFSNLVVAGVQWDDQTMEVLNDVR
jgi:hypothetical protein